MNEYSVTPDEREFPKVTIYYDQEDSGLEIIGWYFLKSVYERGKLLAENSRNTVWLLDNASLARYFRADVVVKRFGHPHIFQRIGNIFRGTKCERAFRKAKEFKKRGIATPRAYAYLEDNIRGSQYLVTLVAPGVPLADYIDATPRGAEVARAFARFVHSMHSVGILHRDLTNTNIFVAETTEPHGYHFEAIDINRAKILPEGKKPGMKARIADMTRLRGCEEFYREFFAEYLRLEGAYTPEAVEALEEARERALLRRDAAKERKRRIKSLGRKSKR